MHREQRDKCSSMQSPLSIKSLLFPQRPSWHLLHFHTSFSSMFTRLHVVSDVLILLSLPLSLSRYLVMMYSYTSSFKYDHIYLHLHSTAPCKNPSWFSYWLSLSPLSVTVNVEGTDENDQVSNSMSWKKSTYHSCVTKYMIETYCMHENTHSVWLPTVNVKHITYWIIQKLKLIMVYHVSSTVTNVSLFKAEGKTSANCFMIETRGQRVILKIK